MYATDETTINRDCPVIREKRVSTISIPLLESFVDFLARCERNTVLSDFFKVQSHSKLE